jgi:hypothetical protein
VVNISATATPGNHFVNWTGDVTDPNASSTTVTVDGNKTVTANFEVDIITYTLTMAVSGSGSTDPAVGDHTYDSGTVVNISATATPGNHFVNWTGADVSTIDDVTAADTTITMSGDYSITANFELIPPPIGLLRVQTVPAVPTRIFVDGIPRNDWGLNWVKMPVGTYMLSFSDVYNYDVPETVTVNYYPGDKGVVQYLTEPIHIYANTVTEVIVNFVQLGNLRVETSPPLPATIYCNGNPIDDWAFWSNIEPGEYIISFETLDGYLTPPPIIVTVTAGAGTHVVGNYIDGTSQVVP